MSLSKIRRAHQPYYRGVWQAPWFGPRGEVVIFAMDSQMRLVGDMKVISFGADHVGAADDLWEALDAADPKYASKPATDGGPTFRRVPKNLRSRLGMQVVR